MSWEVVVSTVLPLLVRLAELFYPKLREKWETKPNAPHPNGEKFIWPTLHKKITLRFGKVDWGNGSTYDHKGVDIKAPNGSIVKAIESGTVIQVQMPDPKHPRSLIYRNGKWERVAPEGRGWPAFVRIECESGREYYYDHVKSKVAEGDKVKAGQVIARTGWYGKMTAPHLHLEMSINGTKTNPELFLRENFDGIEG